MFFGVGVTGVCAAVLLSRCLLCCRGDCEANAPPRRCERGPGNCIVARLCAAGAQMAVLVDDGRAVADSEREGDAPDGAAAPSTTTTPPLSGYGARLAVDGNGATFWCS